MLIGLGLELPLRQLSEDLLNLRYLHLRGVRVLALLWQVILPVLVPDLPRPADEGGFGLAPDCILLDIVGHSSSFFQ
eukprot:1123861-Pyramimonas_sp.AAC.1